MRFLTCAMLCRLAIAIGNTHTKANPGPETRRKPFVRATRVLCGTYMVHIASYFPCLITVSRLLNGLPRAF